MMKDEDWKAKDTMVCLFLYPSSFILLPLSFCLFTCLHSLGKRVHRPET